MGVLLACELGAGRGHVVKLARMARAMGPDLRVIAALSAFRFAAELRADGVDVRRCPTRRRPAGAGTDPAVQGNATWSCYLAASGLLRVEAVRTSLAFWRNLIVAEDISILVADYAPLALRAAQGLQDEGWDIRILSVGTGYGVPPADLPRFPVLHSGYSRVVHPEEAVLDTLNRAGADLGLSPLSRLPALYQADLALPATFALLDPYAAFRAPGALCPPLVDRSSSLAAGDEVFVYFSREEPDSPALIRALERLPLPRRGYLPAASDDTRARLAASGMILEPAPVPADLIAARSALVLHGAPHGTLAMAALAGLPQVALPGHKEQAVHAERAEAAGILRSLSAREATEDAITGAVLDALGDTAFRARARDVAATLRAEFPADPMADLAARLAPQVAAARAFVTG